MATFFEALLNGWWQGMVLTLLVWLVLRDMPRISAATRLAIWQITLVVVLLLPALQRLPAGIFQAPHTSARVPAARRTAATNALAPGEVSASALAPVSTSVSTSVSTAVSTAVSTQGVRPQPLIELPLQQGARVLVAIALLLALIQLFRLALGYGAVRRLKRRSVTADVTLPVAHARPVEVLLSERIGMPMAVGYLHPAVLLPRDLMQKLTPSELRYVLLHESAHLRRGDDWMALAERLLRAIFCFQPAVHWIGRQIERERELACDDWVTAQAGEAKTYASALARLAELGSGGRAPMLAAGAGRRKEIFARLEMLLDRTRNRMPSVSGPLVIIAGALLLLAVFQGAEFNHLLGLSHFSNTWVESDGRQRKEVKMRGDIDFTADDRDVEGMSPGALLVIEQSEGWRSRRVEFEADEHGGIQRRYFSGGKPRAFDAEARSFLAGLLPQWVREQGRNIPEHVTRSIQDKGLDGALEDIRSIRSDSVKRQYLEELFTQADLTEMQLRRTLKIAGDMGSDDDKRQFLQNEHDHYFDHAAGAHAGTYVFDFIDSMHSDDDRKQVLVQAVQSGDVLLPRLCRSVGLMSSDDAKAEVLTEVARVPQRPLPETFFEAAAGMHSDDDRERVLTLALTEHGGDPGTLAQVLRTAAPLDSDEDKAKIVIASASNFHGSDDTLPEAAKVLASIHSDGERRRALEALAQADGKNAATLRELLLQTAAMNSDEDKSHVLLQVAGAFAQDEPVRHAFFSAVNSIHSSEDQRRVLTAVLARQGLAPETLRAVSLAASQIASNEDQVAVLKQMAERPPEPDSK
jgi:beta-lactamase regulating signal transducer with metallopeptidase domain